MPDVGDLVEVKDKSRQMALVMEAYPSVRRDVLDYIEVDRNKMTTEYDAPPSTTDVPYPVHMSRPGGRATTA